MGATESGVCQQHEWGGRGGARTGSSPTGREEDSALVVAVQGGDFGAYEELFRRHHMSVKRVCARRLGDQIEADEVAQATFVRALERIDRCIGDRRFGAWVQVIARRLCVDMIRARARTTPDDDPLRDQRSALNVLSDIDAGIATEEALLRRERTAMVHEALARLPPRQREVVVARHLDGRRPPEIAAALGLSVGAVDSLLLRARRRLALNYERVLGEGLRPQPNGGGTALAMGPARASAPALAVHLPAALDTAGDHRRAPSDHGGRLAPRRPRGGAAAMAGRSGLTPAVP